MRPKSRSHGALRHKWFSVFTKSHVASWHIASLRCDAATCPELGGRPDSARTSAWERHSVDRRTTRACDRTYHLNAGTNRPSCHARQTWSDPTTTHSLGLSLGWCRRAYWRREGTVGPGRRLHASKPIEAQPDISGSHGAEYQGGG